MKIKQSASFNNKPLIAIFALTAAIASAFRIYQVKSVIDPTTGFYYGNSVSITILYVLLAAGCLSVIIMSFLNGNTPPESFPEKKNVPLSIVSALCSASLFFDAAFSLVSAAAADAAGIGTGNVGTFRAMMKTGALPLMCQSFFAFLSAIYFIYLASSYAGGSCKFRKHKILALAPVGWCVFRMIRRFVRQISFINVSDLLLELVMISLLLLFFMAFAQMASGIYADGAKWRLAGFGLSSAVLCIVTSVPRLVFVVVGQTESYINQYHPLYPCDLAIAVFIILVVFLKIGEIEKDVTVTEN